MIHKNFFDLRFRLSHCPAAFWIASVHLNLRRGCRSNAIACERSTPQDLLLELPFLFRRAPFVAFVWFDHRAFACFGFSLYTHSIEESDRRGSPIAQAALKSQVASRQAIDSPSVWLTSESKVGYEIRYQRPKSLARQWSLILLKNQLTRAAKNAANAPTAVQSHNFDDAAVVGSMSTK
jgi:hypothetical protein